MRKILLVVCLFALGFSAQASDPWSILKKVGSGNDSTSSSSSSLGSILGGVVEGLTNTKDFDLNDLVGTWVYQSPAVTLDSSNALQKIGGTAATSVIEDKLAPYYKTAGLTNLVLTVDENLNFTMNMKLGKATGTIAKDEEGNLIFKFKMFNKVNLGNVKTMASKSLSTLTLTFDVSRLKQVLEKVASVSNNATFKSMASILGSYEGIYCGFRLKAQSK